MKACPVCALELEDSYLFCPEDGASLTESTHATAAEAEPVRSRKIGKPRLTRLNLSRPSIDSPRLVKHNPETEAENTDGFGESQFSEGNVEPHAFDSQDAESPEPEQKRFRVAAIATIAALALLVVLGMYAVISGLSRRPSRALQSPNQPSNQTEVAQPFVVTPQEAQNYKEEPAPTPHQDAQPETPSVAKAVSPSRSESGPKTIEQRDRRPDAAQATTTRLPATATAPVYTTPVAAAPTPAPQHANPGDFDSRLVRARASKTASGYRYDLTFNLREQRGRAAQWQRVLVTTRSASGMHHTEALPFFHRLGGTGALTFTISVELTGRSEADWRGRVDCTALGWDNSGAPLQTSFVATVTP